MTSRPTAYLEHPEDVLGQWLDWAASGQTALIMVAKTEGGAVRAPGALMAVRSDGARAGYISGGCIDADVALQARQAIEDDTTVNLRYGAGSPFTDLPLPCGGAIEVNIQPSPDRAAIQACRDQLAARQPASLRAPNGFTAHYQPKLRLRIAGRGADSLALARVAASAGIETTLQLRDGEDVAAARHDGFDNVIALQTPAGLPSPSDDAWTAFVLMFHDSDWETPLLQQALNGPAFYVGAVGSANTHARRCEALRKAGLPEPQVQRVRGPIGLVPSMRDASMLAISALAEIVEAYHQRPPTLFQSTAIILLAAGQSSRFENGDKLLARFKGARLIDHAAARLSGEDVAARIAIVGPDQPGRVTALEAKGWHVIINPDTAAGQGTSLACGIAAAGRITSANAAIVLLADMPGISDTHLRRLSASNSPGTQAVMSDASGTLCPPALFARDTFPALMAVAGDAGARRVFKSLDRTATVSLPPQEAFDIDTLSDLEAAEGLTHA